MRFALPSSLALALIGLTSCAHPLAVGWGLPHPGAGDGSANVKDARAGLEALWKGVGDRNLPAILAAYDPDSVTRHDARARFQGLLALDSLRCEGRLGSVSILADTVEVIAYENLTWSESGRPHADASWRTYKLRRGGDRLTIVSDKERDYVRARFTDLSVDLHPERGMIQGSARIEMEISDPGEDNVLIRLNRGLKILAIEGNDGKTIRFSRCADLITVPLPAAVRSGGPFALAIDFAGAFFNESKEQGYSQVAISPAGSFASWVTDWYPHLRGGGSRSRGRITYLVPSGITVASSGSPSETSIMEGRSRQVFTIRQPLDFSFAAARYFCRTREVEGIALGVYLLQGGEEKADLYLGSAARVLAFLKDYYGTYPFDGYSIVEIPADETGTLGGSSEQGMNLFPAGGLPDDRFPLPLLAHEIGHSWWGNLVEGRDGPVIDEALAQMTAVLSVEKLEGTREMRRLLKRGTPGYPQSAFLYFSEFAGITGRDLPLATPTAGAATASLLHDLVDTKGHFVYEMLRETIGNEAFEEGLREAVSRYAGKGIHLSDLRRIWEERSGQDLGWFFTEWFERSGAPEFKLTYAIARAGDGFDITGKIVQTGEPYAVRAEILLAVPGTSPRIETIAVSGSETPFRIHADRKPEGVLFDPGYKVLRWTDSSRNIRLLTRARALRESGMSNRATAILADYVSRFPEDMTARSDLGICYEDEGSIDLAEGQFHLVLERAGIYDPDDPATALSALHLGQIADRRRRRAEAKEWYAKAAASTDDPTVRAEAEASLATPYKWKPRVAVDRATLARCTGTYVSDTGISLVVAVDDDSLLTASLAGQPSVPLAPGEGGDSSSGRDGPRFRIVGSTEGAFEFSGNGSGPFPHLAVHYFGRDFHLERQDERGEVGP